MGSAVRQFPNNEHSNLMRRVVDRYYQLKEGRKPIKVSDYHDFASIIGFPHDGISPYYVNIDNPAVVEVLKKLDNPHILTLLMEIQKEKSA